MQISTLLKLFTLENRDYGCSGSERDSQDAEPSEQTIAAGSALAARHCGGNFMTAYSKHLPYFTNSRPLEPLRGMTASGSAFGVPYLMAVDWSSGATSRIPRPMFMVGRLASTISLSVGLAARSAEHFSRFRLFLSFMQTIFQLTQYRTAANSYTT